MGKVIGLIKSDDENSIKHYNSSHNILLVGEGDFSFSLCLAKAFGSAKNMVATSLDSQLYVYQNYRKSPSNILELLARGCKVLHCIDATNMAQHDKLRYRKFDRIIFNFPHAEFIPGDSRANQLRRHQNLVRSFFENAKTMLEVDGEVHVTHKSNGFHFQWNLKELASDSGFGLIEEVDFKLEDYPGYSNKYGFDNFKRDLSFSYRPSKTYKFGHDYVVKLKSLSLWRDSVGVWIVPHCQETSRFCEVELGLPMFDRCVFRSFVPASSGLRGSVRMWIVPHCQETLTMCPIWVLGNPHLTSQFCEVELGPLDFMIRSSYDSYPSACFNRFNVR